SFDFQNPQLRNQKLERTISDVLEDELYSPNLSPTTVSDDFVADLSESLSPTWGIKSLPATRTASPNNFRDLSPFRKSSPFYSGVTAESPLTHSQSYHDLINDTMNVQSQPRADNRQLDNSPATGGAVPSLASIKPVFQKQKFSPIQQKLVRNQLQNQQNMQKLHDINPDSAQIANVPFNTPPSKTISPKESLLDYSESTSNATLASYQSTPNSNQDDFGSETADELSTGFNTPTGLQNGYTFTNNDLERGRPLNRLPDHYYSPAQSQISQRQDFEDYGNMSTGSPMPSGSLYSMAQEDNIYVCNECGRRFPRAHNLQLHKRTHNVTPPRKKLPLSAHVGPHRCTWINPSTGKVCNKVFSRPYDLIRHQDTIHASSRKTFKCDLCGDDTKTFSRQDALARHIRVKHEKGK
ncbi:uncharacterized protein V1510DRAFT_370397, partial [Dipodascopsis tothii]|uniref:uncharacterized protein n=1 Tax=Dipodascopsis tothii TaxID=44089 RepID=UPI0034CDA9AC